MKRTHILMGMVLILAITAANHCSLFSADEKDRKPTRVLVESVQPDYAKWQSVTVGMTEAQAKEILGKPIYEAKLTEAQLNNPNFVKELIFGRIKFDSPSVPLPFEFYMFTQQGKVVEIRHPFDAELSRDANPTTPKPIYPRDRTKFDHFPRFVDLRWQPSSGKYPIEYIVDVEAGVFEVNAPDRVAKWVFRNHHQVVSELPYSAFAFGARGPGRWRVKAKNEIGESDWSEWRLFEFEQ